jgi:hypothetical protein
MDLLHVILAFNVVTSITALVSFYAMQHYDDPTSNGKPRAGFNYAGMSGAALGLILMSGIVTLFI